MPLQSSPKAAKIEPQMAPMIDIIFQLLIFFLLTLKIVHPEGDFNINMPVATQPGNNEAVEILPNIKITLKANADGTLAGVFLNEVSKGNDGQAFKRLNSDILLLIGRPGSHLSENVEVEIDADYNLHFRHVIAAVSACTGRLGNDGQVIRYVEKIKFASPIQTAG